MDANIVSFRKLSDSTEAVEKFKKDNEGWVVFEKNTQGLAADAPVSAVLYNDAANKTVTMDYVPFASVAPQPHTMQ